MSFIVDIVIFIIFAVIVVYYTARGFARSLLDVVKLAVAITLSWVAVPMLFSQMSPIIQVVLHVITFFIILLLLTLLFSLIDRIIKKIPVIRTVNRVLGFLLGVGFAYICISGIIAIVCVLDLYISSGIFGMPMDELMLESVLFRFFAEHGAFTIFI